MDLWKTSFLHKPVVVQVRSMIYVNLPGRKTLVGQEVQPSSLLIVLLFHSVCNLHPPVVVCRQNLGVVVATKESTKCLPPLAAGAQFDALAACHARSSWGPVLALQHKPDQTSKNNLAASESDEPACGGELLRDQKRRTFL